MGLGGILCSLLCGALVALPLLVSVLWWASWLSAIAVVAVLARRPPRAAFGHGWLMGIGFHGCVAYWLPQTIERFSPYALWLVVLMFAGYCALIGLQFALFGYASAKLRSLSPILAYPLIWVIVELTCPTVFPWYFGCTQYPWITLIQIAELTGVYGLSFLLLWFGALSFETISGLWKGDHILALRGHLIGFAAVVTLVLLFGWWRTIDLADYLARQRPVTVALVQPNNRPWLRTCRSMSGTLGDEVDLICWPESAVIGPYSLAHDDLKSPPPPSNVPLNSPRPLRDLKSHLLFGTSSRVPPPVGVDAYHVSALLINPDEEVIGRYHKRSLVPFGEFIPGERWFPSLHRFSAFPLRYLPGSSDEPLVIPDLAKLGVLICYEDIVSRTARASVRGGADLLVNVTNDFWFGQSRALGLHLQLAIFRAVENKRFLLRSTTTGATAVIAPTGEIIARAPDNEPHVLLGNVQPVALETFYTRWGDVFAWLCLAATVALAVVRRGRTRHDSPTRT